MPSVTEVIDKCKSAGLVVSRNPGKTGHTLWDIVDPSTGTIITGISSHAGKQGGDQNWHWNIRRILRSAGFEIDFGESRKRSKRNQSIHRTPKKRKPAVDLAALKIAQDRAAAAGERIPLVDDLEDYPAFLSRAKIAGRSSSYTEEAQQEVVSNMAPKAEAPRFKASMQRLRAMLENREDELVERAKARFATEGKRFTSPSKAGTARSEFVHIAIEEVAPKRNLRAWKTQSSGFQALYTALERDASLSLWAVNLIEATMDHIEGLKWGVDETLKTPQAVQEPEPVKEPKPEPKPAPAPIPEDIAFSMIEEYEEAFRQIAEECVSSRTVSKAEWATVYDKPLQALEAVRELRRVYDATLDDLERKKEVDRILATEELEPVVAVGMDEIRQRYADTLLGMLSNQTGSGKNDQILTLILDRLDKLAGI